MALPSLRGHGAVVHSSASSFTVLLPVAAVAGDLAVCYLFSNAANSDWVRYPRPWTVKRGTRTWTQVVMAGGTNRAAAFVIVLNAADIAAGTVTVTNSFAFGETQPTSAVISAYQDGVGVEASATKTSYSSSFRSYQAPVVSLAKDESLVIEAWLVSGAAAPSSAPATIELSSASGTYGSFVISEQAQPAPGTSVPESAAMATALVNWTAFTISVYGYGPPLAPTLLSPAPSTYEDLAAGGTFTWAFNTASEPATTQVSYAFRRKVGAGAYEYWNAGLALWQGTPEWNPSATPSVTFPAGHWTNGTSYQWSVATEDSVGQGDFALDNVVNASSPPTVTVTAPAGMAGSSQPTVTWTETLETGASQVTYRVVVESGSYGAAPGSGTTQYDSGVVNSSSLSAVVGSVLGTTMAFRVFVQITENGGQSSAWSHSDFNTVFSVPAAPVVSAVWDSVNARAIITVTTAFTLYSLEASEDGGTTWLAVRDFYDYERTPQAEVIYRARVSDGTGPLLVVSNQSASSAPITAWQTDWWIKDVFDSTLNRALCDAQQNVRNRKGDSLAIYPAGRVNPVVLRGPVHGADGSFRTVVRTEADRSAALALYVVQNTILIQDPRGRQWYAEWVGDLTETPFTVPLPYYAIERGWVEVDVPS